MNLSKTSVKGLGVLVSAALLFSTGAFIINPLLEQRSGSVTELESLQKITESKKANLTRLTNGAVNSAEAFKVGNNFINIVPKSKNIESASRAISDAIIPGVSIVSFNFNPEEPSVKDALPKASLEGYKPPASFGKTPAAPKAGATTGTGAKSPLNRVPVIASVTATSYQKLSEYTDKLSKQGRLLNVVSISATSTDGGVKADIYAFAFIDKSQ